MAKRKRNRGQNTPPTHKSSAFRVDIELEAVCDYMTMLRGFSAHGEFYEGFVSDQLTRFPSFDGSDWEELLPGDVDFRSFLVDAIEGNSPKKKRLFEKVRPYDFAYRDLTYLRRNGGQIVIQVPPTFQPYLSEIKAWAKNYFPPNENFKSVRVVPLETNPKRSKADVWVIRNPDTAELLKLRGQRFILIDGKENSKVENVVRVVRWDQVGFLLRHAQLIKYLGTKQPDNKHISNPVFGPIYPPHKDILFGNPIELLRADDALLWISRQLQSIENAIQNPTWALRFGRRSTEVRRQFPPELIAKVIPVLMQDHDELLRKAGIVRQDITEKSEQILIDPSWTSLLRKRESQMSMVLADLEGELKIDPVTGSQTQNRMPRFSRTTTTLSLGDRILSGDPNTPIILQLSGADVFHILSRHFDSVRRDIKSTEPSNVAGTLAELTVTFALEESKWKILRPKKEPNGIASNTLIHSLRSGVASLVDAETRDRETSIAEVNISWTDLKTGEVKSADVDFVAKSPSGQIVIGEVKVSTATPLSDLQIDLRNHIRSGGRIHNPALAGVKGKTFQATWREIRVNDLGIDLSNAVIASNRLEL